MSASLHRYLLMVLATTLALPLAGAAAAQGGFVLPEGCTAHATMQKRGCLVSHLFHCAGDPADWQRRADLDEDGLSYLGAIDDEARWQESRHLEAGRTERLEPDSPDHASLTTLLETGHDAFDFVVIDDLGYRTRFTGSDALTGERQVLDGVTLDGTTFDVTARDAETGAPLWSVSGTEWISREWRAFVSGRSAYVTSQGSYEVDRSPMEIVRPGEAGFLATSPKFDCGALMSSLDAPSPDGSL